MPNPEHDMTILIHVGILIEYHKDTPWVYAQGRKITGPVL